MLQGDPQLLSILSSLRASVTTTMSGAASGMSYLGTIGLSTGAAVGSGTISQDSLKGKLTLDTTKLTSALASNFCRREGALREQHGRLLVRGPLAANGRRREPAGAPDRRAGQPDGLGSLTRHVLLPADQTTSSSG